MGRLNENHAQDVIDHLKGILPGDVPEHLLQADAQRHEDDFDLARVFSVLTHLKNPPGKIVDYVYSFRGMGGSPLFYIRDEAMSPFVTESALREHRDSSIVYGDAVFDEMYSDNTPEGYFELAVFRIMARQFYLCWHDCYFDGTILGGKAGMQKLFNEKDYWLRGPELPSEALTLDPRPTFRRLKDHVRISALVFTKWGGFIRDSIRMTTAMPHRLVHRQQRQIVPYDCGIIF